MANRIDGIGAVGRRLGRWRTALVLVGLLATTAACDKVQLTAPTESSITLFASATSIPLGGSTEIVASVIEQGGTPVQNGTVVTFSSTVGSIDPREARTRNGKVTARLTAGNISGRAQIRAFSGGAQSDTLEVTVGAAAVATVLLRAEPGSLPPSGGTVALVATVLDESGNRLAGVAVTFTTTAGQLASSSLVTDVQGEARTTLSTSREATVTATASSTTATRTVSVGRLPSISIAVAPTAPLVGQAVTFGFTLTAGDSPINRLDVDFGDGNRRSLAVSGNTSVAHVYGAPGLYTVQARVGDTSGQSNYATAVINVTAPLTTGTR